MVINLFVVVVGIGVVVGGGIFIESKREKSYIYMYNNLMRL